MKRRCEILVRARRYGAPGQCEKRTTLRVVRLADTPVTVCAHHAAVLGRGREVARA